MRADKFTAFPPFTSKEEDPLVLIYLHQVFDILTTGCSGPDNFCDTIKVAHPGRWRKSIICGTVTVHFCGKERDSSDSCGEVVR